MSLSGLDAPAVDNAYKTVQEERGGWFLLSYATRDTVEVHAQGVRGVHEMRDAALEYYNSCSDVKPVFGLTQFRRRRVVIKLVPDNSSLLFKARVQVHWLAVTSRFAYHDLAYEITTPEELDEQLLTQHIELHSSRSSSGSTQKPKLDGIEEDAEEVSNPEKADDVAKTPGQTPKRSVEQPARSPAAASVQSAEPSLRPHIDTASLIERSKRLAAALDAPDLGAPEIKEPRPQVRNEEEARQEESTKQEETRTPGTKEYAISVTSYRFNDDGDDSSSDDMYDIEDRRMSSQTARPTTSDHAYYASLFRPKVKLGPRPSMEKRPAATKSEARPVASLPAGLRAQRPSIAAARPKSRDSALVGLRIPPPPPIPETPTTLLPKRPGSSGASVKSLPATLPKSPRMTPEKARLMKFRDMYRQREAKSKARLSAMPDVPPVPDLPKDLNQETVEPVSESRARLSGVLDVTPIPDPPKDRNQEKEDSASEPPNESPAQEESTASAVASDHGKSDSGVGIDESTSDEKVEPNPETRTKDVTLENKDLSKEHLVSFERPHPTPASEQPSSINTESSPVSLIESPVHASTRPSSVSESSTHEKAPAEEPDLDQLEEAGTPSTVVGNKPTQSPEHHDAEDPIAALDPAPSMDDESDSPEPAMQELKHEEAQTATNNAAPAMTHSRQGSAASAKARRHGVVDLEMPAVNISATTSEADYDDDLMDEMETAQVHEATPISVSKSPITPVFPRQPSFQVEGERKSSATATPPFGADLVRTPSASNPTALPQQTEETIAVAKKIKIETGIAAKIADLQKSFSRGSPSSLTPSPNNRSPESGKPSLVYQRASSLRTTTPPRISSANWQQNRPSSKASLSSVEPDSPERDRTPVAPTMGSRIGIYSQQPHEKASKADTISVTARIVRTDRPQKPSLVPPSAGQTLELHESPLTVTHKRASSTVDNRTQLLPGHPIEQPAPSPVLTTVHSESSTSLATATSPTEAKEPSGPYYSRRSTDSQGGWRIGRRLSRTDAKSPTSPTSAGRSLSQASLETSGSGESAKEAKEEKKKGSRASRLIRRMSASMSSIAMSRLPLGPLSPQSLKSDDGAASLFMNPPISPVMEAPPRPLATDIGDLNVQFPDTLLWKRRWVEIDAHGFVVLKPYGANDRATTANGVVKRYHLNEFEPPFAPELERQEMPNSIIIDFKDGRTLQLSCSSAMGQKAVLRLLAECYHGWRDAEA